MADVPDGMLRVLKAIHTFRAHHGFSPTIRELCVLLEIASTHAISCHFEALERHGLITRQFAQARTTVLTEAGLKAVAP